MLDEPKNQAAGDNLDYVRDLPGFERGHPHYFKDPMIDHLLEIVMLLGGELWTVKDRQAVTEHLLATEGKVTPEMIEQFRPSADMKEKLARDRQTFVKHVYSCLYSDRAKATKTDYFGIVGKGE
ncbi:MAG: hypothetical protein KDE14_10630 [Rhodobacteraceae bacterium]|nr:hypothetical protein [Paracoccaceae bacterium]